MHDFRLFLGVDPCLGRVDRSLLSDQTLMEILIEGFDDDTKEEYQDTDGVFRDVCKWSCITCDDEQRVIKIDKDSGNLSGSIQLRYVPPKAKVLRITSWAGSKLTGSVDLMQLPEGMQILSLEVNQLTGDIDLTRLPDKMDVLFLNNNQLTGEIDLTHLPDRVRGLYLSNNQLTGGIDLTHLPYGMEYLFLQCNNLTGEIDVTQLPDGMKHLYLNSNQLTGEIDLTQLPDGMVYLYLNNNQLSGSLVIKRLPFKHGRESIIHAGGNNFNAIAVVNSDIRVRINFRGSGVTSVVDENGRELNIERFLI